MYAAFGLRQLLQEAGQTVQIVGGPELSRVARWQPGYISGVLARPPLRRQNHRICEQESRSATGDVKLPNWRFRDMGSLQYAVQRGDAWARGAMCFIKTRPTVSLPF